MVTYIEHMYQDVRNHEHEIMLDNMVYPGRTYDLMRLMLFACWITKATAIQSEYVWFLILQQPLVRQCLLVTEDLRSHSDAPHSGPDRPDAETST
jgi:hypothetical protein